MSHTVDYFPEKTKLFREPARKRQ